MSNYSIKPGVRQFETEASVLYVVSRIASQDTPRNITTNAIFEPLESRDGRSEAWASILFDPIKLGKLSLWRDLPKLQPVAIAELFEKNVKDNVNRAKIVERLVQLSLLASSGSIKQPVHDEAIDILARTAPLYYEAIPQTFHLHTLAVGSLEAHIRRHNSSEVATVQ